ncbi:MAG: NTP transferase domain-containing protein [Elusimicrobia bacterium]|jgi:bifunctional UDP-N-acetylglucosamine pyrophosphorylase/glucosamine-1-phosphate N-acetyltransferase|nr:NTP transferase domain-containing protein [Elusimicrobiota bacterium]
MKSLKFVILAGGRGVRMKSDLPKPLKKLKGKTMLKRVVGAAADFFSERVPDSIQDNIIVVESDDRVKKAAEELGCITARQENPLGTADALIKALPFAEDADDIIVACADVPLIKGQTFKELYRIHKADKNYITLIVSKVDDPKGYGRVIIKGGEVAEIVEEKEASHKEQQIDIINGGIYCIKAKGLKEYLQKIKRSPVKGEFYLTDLVKITAGDGRRNGIIKTGEREIKGINRPEQLKAAEEFI